MEGKFDSRLRFVEGFSRQASFVVLVWLPIAIWGAWHATTESARVHNWLPNSHAARTQYDDFRSKFGDDQFLIVSWQNASLQDPRVDAFVSALRSIDSQEQRARFNRIDTTKSVYDRLRAEPLNVSDEEARQRITHTLLGQDGTACVLISLNAVGVEHASQTLKSLEVAASQVDGLEASELKVAGTLFEEATVDDASHNSLRWLAPLSTLAAILVATVALYSLRDGLLVLVLAGVGQLTAIAVLFYSGGQFSAVLIVLPTLVFMLSLSSAVHLVNYFRTARVENHNYLGGRALCMGLRPSLLASTTTAVGMLSLVQSHLSPVRQFGLYSAGCLVCASVILLAIFAYAANLILAGRQTNVRPILTYDWLVQRIVNNDTWLAVFGCLLLLASVVGISRLTASTRFDDMFPNRSRAISNMRWIEEHIGPLVSIEVLLCFPEPEPDLLQRVRWLTAIQGSLEKLPEVGCTLSAASFLPPVPETSGLRGSVTRSVYSARLRKEIPQLAEQGWIHDTGEQVWRVTCKMSALGKDDFSRVAHVVSAATDATIFKYADQHDAPRHMYSTGLTPIINETQLLLLRDLGSSFLMAFALITPMMMLITRSLTVGLLAMLPNVLPIALVFGAMGWLSVPIDIAGILTASIALGIAVDDTCHLISWHAASRRGGHDTVSALRYSLNHCATAMLQTTMISCAAMLPFFFAEFIPTRRFAILMVCMLCGAILGDLIFLSALLSLSDRWRGRQARNRAIEE